MASILTLGTSANSSGVPRVGFVDTQREYLAQPRVTYSWDGSARYDPDDMSAEQAHRAVPGIPGVYEDVFETDWIEQFAPRKLGIGKNAGG
jgi:hypothetical protein